MILVRDIRLPLSAGEPQAFEKALHLARVPRAKVGPVSYTHLPGQWLDVLDDLHQPYRPLAAVEDEPGEENSREFVPFAGFNTENLLHNTELTQSV